jgi:hypothetical protein
MIAKTFRTYKMISLRHEKSIRDHGIREGGVVPVVLPIRVICAIGTCPAEVRGTRGIGARQQARGVVPAKADHLL